MRLVERGLLIGGLALVALAQVLPVATSPIFSVDGNGGNDIYVGSRMTLGGWWLASFSRDYVALLGWTANLWLVVALVARATGWFQTARWTAAAAPGCALIGVGALYRSDELNGVYVGAWVWLAGCASICTAILLWATAKQNWQRPPELPPR